MKKAYIKYITALLLFGTNGIVASNINLASYYIVLYRTLLGFVLLAAFYLIKRNKFTFYKHKKDFVFICISGIAMGASWMLLYEAYVQIGVGLSSLLYYCGPVLVMILSPFLFGERLTAVKITGFLSVLVGIFLVNGQANDSINAVGIICGGLSAVMYCIMVVANKKSAAIVGMENSLLQLIFAFLTVAVFVLLKSGTMARVDTSDIAWIILLGFVNTGIGCYFYFSSIGNLPVQSVAILGYIEPLSAVILSVLLLGEKMLPLQIIGAVLIIGGAVLGECVNEKRCQKAPF